MNTAQYKETLCSIYGKTIAIVYIFEGDEAEGYKHYEIWKSDVISSWMFAVEELHCMPLIMDMRTFVQKAMNNTLPYIDYVINLNNGTLNISVLGVVPSICNFLNIPCIPCDTTTIVCGENKKISNIIANYAGLNIPKELTETMMDGIIRPIGLGSSLGIKKIGNMIVDKDDNFLYQEFIKGCDITTPLLYNPLTSKLEVLPGVLYFPNEFDANWFLGEEQKRYHSGYSKKITMLSPEASEKYISLAYEMGINTYCRIDARLKCDDVNDLYSILQGVIPLERLYFLEINPMPTIKANINFHTSLDGLTEQNPLYACYDAYKELVQNASHTGFILSNAIISYL